MFLKKNLQFVFGLLLCLVISNVVFAQAANNESGVSPASSSTIPVVKEDPPAKTFFQNVDGAFKTAVDFMEHVLFYRLGQSERKYIVFERNSIYQRERASNGPFQLLDSKSAGESLELTDEAVQVLAAQGKLLDGHTVEGEPKPYRLGML